MASAALYLKDTLGKQGVQELISNLSKDIGELMNYVCFFGSVTDIDVFYFMLMDYLLFSSKDLTTDESCFL